MDRRLPSEIVDELYTALESSDTGALSINEVSELTKLHRKTVNRYVELIEEIQRMPHLEVIKSRRTTLLRIGGLLSLPDEEQKRIIKAHYPSPGEDTRFLIELYRKGVISSERSVKLKDSKLVRELMKREQIEKKGGRVYLTDLGKTIALGAIDIYG